MNGVAGSILSVPCNFQFTWTVVSLLAYTRFDSWEDIDFVFAAFHLIRGKLKLI